MKFEKDVYKYDKTTKTLRINRFIRKVSNFSPFCVFRPVYIVLKSIVADPFLTYVKLHENLKRMGTNMIEMLKF